MLMVPFFWFLNRIYMHGHVMFKYNEKKNWKSCHTSKILIKDFFFYEKNVVFVRLMLACFYFEKIPFYKEYLIKWMDDSVRIYPNSKKLCIGIHELKMGYLNLNIKPLNLYCSIFFMFFFQSCDLVQSCEKKLTFNVLKLKVCAIQFIFRTSM